ncbi:MAG: glycogen synthase [Candidatus Kerfeldbacteria bacterium]|nr:glycogen synthase [Candidatus Kerfeldbacteria bacterium]
MRVLFAAAEMTPIAKVGGLADVVGALPIALQRAGVDVRIILPRYEQIDLGKLQANEQGPLNVTVGEGPVVIRVWEGTFPGAQVPLILLEHGGYLSRGPIYFEEGTPEALWAEMRRFLVFQLAVSAYVQRRRWTPDILHCHDWQASLLPLLTRGRVKTLLTIHNLAMPGLWNAQEVRQFLCLKDDELPELTGDGQGKLSLLGLGISTADKLNTVSPTYAQEILTPELGLGLEGLLKKRRNDLSGILNGIDGERFNPAQDPAVAPYDADHLDGKQENRVRLLKRFKLLGNGPVFGFVGRLTDQKGSELIVGARQFFAHHDANLVVLGKGNSTYEDEVRALADALPNATAVIGFDATLAQQIYAGSDFFLMPSRFEPCGLGQLIALRYGAVPIVRATGGLKDTVTDIGEAQGTGIVFRDFTPSAFQQALDRAVTLYADRERFRSTVERGMRQVFSWDRSAATYRALYDKLMSAGKGLSPKRRR